VFVAPASKLLTVLHIADIGDGGEEPRTRCGIAMDPAGLWQSVARDNEPVCRACQGLTEEQGALL
jgi:hypothetical protein